MTPSVSLCHGSYGARILVSFPRGVDIEEALPVYELLRSVFFAVDSESVTPPLSSAEPAVVKAEYVPWPAGAKVTAKEIADAWHIGISTWQRLVAQNPHYPQKLDIEGRASNAPALWDSDKVAEALRCSGTQRRRK